MVDSIDEPRQGPAPVAITGMGVVSPVGIGLSSYWDGLEAGVDAIKPLDRFPADTLYTSLAAQVPGEYFGEAFSRAFRRGALARLYVEEAVRQAVGQAGLVPKTKELAGAGFAVGTTLAEIGIFERYLEDVLRDPSLCARSCREVLYHRLVEGLAAVHGSSGYAVTVNTACTSGHQALSVGAGWIRRGRADVAVVAGVDALCPTAYTGFVCLRALSATRVRPFDARRDGLALGEGAGALVLEDCDHARQRGARIHAYVRGYGSAGDANHMSGPDRNGAGLARAIRACLKNGCAEPGDIDMVSAHGTATVYNDRMESIALKTALGETAARTPVLSLKSRFGHTLGAAGALEIIAGVLALQKGVILTTVNHEGGDGDCDLDYVAGGNRTASLARVLFTAAGFGGQNAAVLIEGPHG